LKKAGRTSRSCLNHEVSTTSGMNAHADMDTPLNLDVAGREFDKWLDWNGTANCADHSETDLHIGTAGDIYRFPISPSSISHSETHTTVQNSSLTASSTLDLPTPRHSSASPEARSSIDFRLSGDTLREGHVPVERTFLKRKLSSDDVPITEYHGEAATPAVKKRPHNVIEKRYRANLNEKIAELRDSVPSLRISKKARSKDSSAGVESDEEETLDGLAPSNKLNKASVLTKAVEYIRHLEFRTKRLEDENRSLKERLETLDRLLAEGGQDAQRAAAFTSDKLIEEAAPPSAVEAQASPPATETSTLPPQGLIPTPDSWRRLRQSQPQEHYGHIYDSLSERSRFKGKWPSRIMLGSLATLMVMEGFGESQQGTESREKGLFGIPLELLDGWTFLRSPKIYLATFTQFCQAGGIFPLIKGFVAVTFLAFVVFAYLFHSKPPPKDDVEEVGMRSSTQSPAPASPIEVRRRAWSTSMQTLGLPHHSFFPEWAAITSEWVKYTVRYVFGPRAYAWLTGRTADDDTARVKAWDIAIDAQLAGGDIEVSRSRVVLTSFGSGTLPRTPLRLMLKALHCRVLLWNVGSAGGATARMANTMGTFFANRQWRRARHLHKQLPARDPDRLPPYLSALLEMNCDDVFLDMVCQRAYNLMYDRPTQESSSNALMNVVVEDYAVRSPLDAVAAWRSTYSLTEALEMSLECPDAVDLVRERLKTARRIAPPGSAAETRTLAACAVFGTTDRRTYYARAAETMASSPSRPTPSSPHPDDQVPYFIDSSTPASARADITNCLHCAKTLLVLDGENDPPKALAFFSSLRFENQNTTVLTAAALKQVLRRLPIVSSDIQGTTPPIGSGGEEVRALSQDFVSVADAWGVHYSMQNHQRRRSMASNDTGYESQDESLHAWSVDLDTYDNKEYPSFKGEIAV